VRHPLSCLECPAVSDEFERGWRGFLTDEELEPAEVAILCPACSEREFGRSCDSGSARTTTRAL
jgi:hypothetical protein